VGSALHSRLTEGIIMVIQRSSWVYKLLALVPVQCSPYKLQAIRVGKDYFNYVAVIPRRF
jgi:hypothetical protein